MMLRNHPEIGNKTEFNNTRKPLLLPTLEIKEGGDSLESGSLAEARTTEALSKESREYRRNVAVAR